MSKLKIFDATLRDGSHAIKHQLTEEQIRNYCLAMDDAGMDAIIVGHGNGLGASSLQVGLSRLTDHEMLSTARKYLHQTKLGVYMIPGFGTIRDQLIPAIEDGVELFKIGCHCTEADTTRSHIEYLAANGKEVYGILMMYHMASPEKLLEETRKMQSYGAKGVILMDSAGTSTIEMVKRTISMLYNGLDIRVGFHSHNNMGIAVATMYTAIQEGASIIDGTIAGFGAGAGNCQLEALVALLQKCGVQTDADLYKMLDCSEMVMPSLMGHAASPDPISIVSGQAGVFSAFKVHVLRAAKNFGVDPRDVFMEVGRRKAVAGQEDIIIEVAQALKHKQEQRKEDYQIESLL